MNTRTRWLIPLLAAASLAPAQEARLNGPVSGFVYDEHAHAIRVMMGVPGTAYLGASFAGELSFAAVAPNGRVAITLKEGRLELLRLDGELRSELLARNYPTPSLSSWSANSDAVSLYGSEAGVHVWRHIGGTVEPAGLGNPSALGSLSALALEDSTRSVAFVVDGEEADSLYRLTEGSEPTLLARAANLSAIAVGPNAVYFADRAAHTIAVARDAAGSTEIAQLANESLGVSDPTGLAITGDTLLVASAGGHELLRLNASTGELLGRVALDFTPGPFVTLVSGAYPLYSLKSRASSADPLQVLDAARGTVSFVPAAAAGTAASTAAPE